MDAIKLIMDLFGPAIIVPTVVFILSLFLKVEVKQAFRGALFMGIGLTAFGIILGALMGSLAPIVSEMVTNTGINLPTIDVGWPAAAMIVYANHLGMLYLVLGLGFNLVLFLTKYTDTFQPTDIWNYYQFVFWAIVVQVATGNFWLGIIAAMFMNLIILFVADWLAPSLQEYYGYEGVTSTCAAPIMCAPFAVIVKWILMKTKIHEIKVNPEEIRRKFGFWGEPVIMGLLIGFIIAALAKFSQLGSLGTWSIVLNTAIVTGAVMVLYPAVSGLFVKGLIPISQTMNTRLRKGELKRKKFNIGIDPAIFFGESATLTTGLLLIPIILLLSIFMPGNNTVPLADLPAMPFMVIGIIAVMRGNILSAAIAGIIWYMFGNWVNSDITAIFTQAAVAAGVDIPAGGTMITAWSIAVSPIFWAVYKAFSAPEGIRIFTIILSFAVYFVLFYMFKTNQKTWHKAADASEEFLNQKYGEEAANKTDGTSVSS